MLKLIMRTTTRQTIMKQPTTKALCKLLKNKRRRKTTCGRLLLLKLSNSKRQLNNGKSKLRSNEHLNLPKRLLKPKHVKPNQLNSKESL